MSEINLDELSELFIKNMKGQSNVAQTNQVNEQDLDNYMVSDDGLIPKNKPLDFSQNSIQLTSFDEISHTNEDLKENSTEKNIEKKKRGRKKIDPSLKKPPAPYVKKKDRVQYQKSQKISLQLPVAIEECIRHGFMVVLQPDGYYIEGFYDQTHVNSMLNGFVKLQESDNPMVLIGVDKKGMEYKISTFLDLLKFNHAVWMSCYKKSEHKKPDLKWFAFLFENGLINISPK